MKTWSRPELTELGTSNTNENCPECNAEHIHYKCNNCGYSSGFMPYDFNGTDGTCPSCNTYTTIYRIHVVPHS